jgi:hypothetical protein
MGKYLDIIDATHDINDINDQRRRQMSVPPPFSRLSRFGRTFAELECRCPDYVDTATWHAAIADGRKFISRWGAQAERLGWSAQDLFGLHQPPSNPHPSYSRLWRHDCAGLIWCLDGRPVIALTTEAATVKATAGTLTWRRRARS